jgi:hydroxyacylglutathione hydrolase
MIVKRISDNIWKVVAGSNLYFLDLDVKILVDAGDRAKRSIVETSLSKIVKLEDIQRVLFTHLHYDHIGNFDLFRNAEFYASAQEIDSLGRDREGTILDQDIAEKFMAVKLKPLHDMEGLQVIETPGHTKGSVCLWLAKERILFSGDTLFADGVGRTDLPTSEPPELKESLMKLVALNHRILCPGHDY